MGDRSDRQYHGVHDPKDWTKGLKKPAEKETSYADQVRENKAYSAMWSFTEAKRILTEQLPRFKLENNKRVRVYSGVMQSLGAISRLFERVGITPDQIACSSEKFPGCQNLQSLMQAVDQLEVAGIGHKEKSIKKRLGNELTVSLTLEQFDALEKHYTSILESAGPKGDPQKKSPQL